MSFVGLEAASASLNQPSCRQARSTWRRADLGYLGLRGEMAIARSWPWVAGPSEMAASFGGHGAKPRETFDHPTNKKDPQTANASSTTSATQLENYYSSSQQLPAVFCFVRRRWMMMHPVLVPGAAPLAFLDIPRRRAQAVGHQTWYPSLACRPFQH